MWMSKFLSAIYWRLTFPHWEFLAPLPKLHYHILLFSHSVLSNSLWHHGLQHTSLPCPSLSHELCSNSCPLSERCIQATHLLFPRFPPAFNLSQHQGLFQWLSSSDQVAKLLELQLQHQSFQWIFRVGCL